MAPHPLPDTVVVATTRRHRHRCSPCSRSSCPVTPTFMKVAAVVTWFPHGKVTCCRCDGRGGGGELWRRCQRFGGVVRHLVTDTPSAAAAAASSAAAALHDDAAVTDPKRGGDVQQWDACDGHGDGGKTYQGAGGVLAAAAEADGVFASTDSGERRTGRRWRAGAFPRVSAGNWWGNLQGVRSVAMSLSTDAGGGDGSGGGGGDGGGGGSGGGGVGGCVPPP